MSRPALRHLVGILAVVLVAAGVGFLLGQTAAFVAVALAALLALQLRNLLRLERWLRRRDVDSPPDVSGLWGEVVTMAYRIHRRKLYHEHRVTSLVREFRRMTAAMPDGVILLGAQREILWFNAAAGRWLNLRRKLDRGIRIDNLVRYPEVVEYLEGRGAGAAPHVHLPGPDDRWLAFYLVSYEGSEQQLLIVRDVTAESRLDAMRKDFVANASHELRSPLTVISGYLDTMAEDPDLDAGWHQPVQEMRRQSDRMRGILQDLLELSRLEAQGGPAGNDPVDVTGMLASLRREFTSRTEPTAAIALDLQEDACLLGAEPELHSVFSNLLSNALKYTPSDGQVRIRWWADEQGGHVSVQDSGIGIAAEHLPRLTERFYRVDTGRSRKLGGSGLGLSIVKHALQRHGARLEVQSVLGKGSTFTCHFPVARVSVGAP
jgi:two-component system, OmpR family, phosphate regulon sensor histidine kinase PhoR